MPILTAAPARPRGVPAAARHHSYAHAHWWLLAALGAVVAGFWPSFYGPRGTGDPAHTMHGITATLWMLVLPLQAWLAARGYVVWHRRMSRVAFVLLPVLCVTALYMVRVMLNGTGLPPGFPSLLAFIDVPSVLFLLVLVTLALRNVRTPEAHKRFMAATVLIGFPPALTRLYARLFAPVMGFGGALQWSFVTVEVILVALIVADWRAGQRRLAYPLSLAFFATIHAAMGPAASSPLWAGFTGWFAAVELPL